MKALWLERALTSCACSYALFLNEKDFYIELGRCNVPVADWPKFVMDGGDATTHHFKETADRRAMSMVCLDAASANGRDPIVVAGILVHEAVHIWQQHARLIGSFNDHGDEEEAYAIQNIAQQLMWSYREQLSKRNHHS